MTAEKSKLSAWQKELAEALRNLKGWYMQQHPTMNGRLWTAFYKDIFTAYRKHCPELPAGVHDFYYVFHKAEDDTWSMDWYQPGAREGTFTVAANYCAIRPVNERDGDSPVTFERIGPCPLQMNSTQHVNLVRKLLQKEMETESVAVILRIPKAKPYERAFRNGIAPEGYWETIPLICHNKPW